ncbi:hypothetical protein OF83DRAFT_1057562, partial [Amylostereum chailletii]
MDEIRSDMEKTTLPSWIQRVPTNFGQPGQRRMKADQWRIACGIHLPITLVEGENRGPDKYVALQNFLALVVAVRWSTMHVTSITSREFIQENFLFYLASLIYLYGKESLVPNHHLCLHLVECLRLFGPVHSWWAFPFERYNGVIQRINTNYKLG